MDDAQAQRIEDKLDRVLALLTPLAKAWADLRPKIDSLLQRAKFSGLRRG